jgi:hypothetical protein
MFQSCILGQITKKKMFSKMFNNTNSNLNPANCIGRFLNRRYAKGMLAKASIATTTPNMAINSVWLGYPSALAIGVCQTTQATANISDVVNSVMSEVVNTACGFSFSLFEKRKKPVSMP